MTFPIPINYYRSAQCSDSYLRPRTNLHWHGTLFFVLLTYCLEIISQSCLITISLVVNRNNMCRFGQSFTSPSLNDAVLPLPVRLPCWQYYYIIVPIEIQVQKIRNEHVLGIYGNICCFFSKVIATEQYTPLIKSTGITVENMK